MERQEETAESDWLSLLLLLLQPCIRSDNDFFFLQAKKIWDRSTSRLGRKVMYEKNLTKEKDKRLSYKMSVWLKGPEGSLDKNYVITFWGPENSTPSYVII